MRRLGLSYPVMEKREDELSGSGEEDLKDKKDPNGNENPDQNSEVIPSESESPFSHPLLKGKTPAEVEEIFAAHAATVREQGRRLNELENNPSPRREEPAPEPKKKVTFDEFVAEPDTTIASIVRRELQEVISPFKENLAQQKAAGAWAELEEEYPDYKDYKEIMQDILREHGIAEINVNVKTLKSTYIMARGRAAIEGNTVERKKEEPAPKRNAPPQHDPSRQVLPNNGGSPRVRKLTETERTVAKMQGFPDTAEGHAAYLRDLEMDEGKVATYTEAKK